uniref:RING-type domain-containing protein n=1 Tax=Podarcis muralis TaxID=64176 RepID=A0A670HYJ5_PODMU
IRSRGRKQNHLSLPGEAAMAGSPAQDLCDEAICSICLEYFQDPVIIPECGHNFCRSCLSQWWEKSEAEASCPQCREQIKQRNLIPNHCRHVGPVLFFPGGQRGTHTPKHFVNLCNFVHLLYLFPPV